LLAASVGVALAVAEGVVRVFALAPTTGVTVADAETFARLPGIFTPSRVWRGIGFPVRFDATTDSLGYRGREPAAPDDALRVVFVGDSFAFGSGVQDDETWPARLQASLVCDRPVVVYNAGLPATALPEAIAMAERARVLRPHAVVAEFTAANDVRDLVGPTYWSQLEARERAGWLRDVTLRTLAHSGVWNLVRRRLHDRETAALVAAPPEAYRAARERYARLLATWAARLREDGVPLVYVAYPSLDMLRTGDRELHDWALATARQAGLEPVDLWPVLAGGDPPVSELFLADRHPNPAGYSRVAPATAAALRAQAAAFARCHVR
jgi:lysophospholipase L1-like esterase